MAGWWRRLLGWFIDGIVTTAPVYVIQIVLGAVALSGPGALGGLGDESKANVATRVIVNVVFAALDVAYPVIMLSRSSRTLGMMALRMRAVDLVSGGPLVPAQVWRRTATFFALVQVPFEVGFVANLHNHNVHHPVALMSVMTPVSFLLMAIAALWAVRSSRNQTIQDKVASTLVVMS